MTDNCTACGNGFRIETTDLATGRVKAVLHPVTAEWAVPDSVVGTGQMVVATRDPSADDIWPHASGLYISQVNTDGTREGRYGGIIEAYDGSDGGATNIGLQSIDEYFFHRLIADDFGGLTYTVTGRDQRLIAADLVTLASDHGVPIEAEVDLSVSGQYFRDRTWNLWELKNIGEALNELTQVENGVRYRLKHEFNDGYWTTKIVFYDPVIVDRGIMLRSDIEALKYGVQVDASDQANWAYAVGEGEEADQKSSVAYDEAAQDPRWHAAPAWKDVSIQQTLDEHARGYVAIYRDPIAVPSMTLAGLVNPPPNQLITGDQVYVDIGYGVIAYKGDALLLSQTWKLDSDGPVMRTLALSPAIRSSMSVKTQVPIVSPEPAPAPTTPVDQQPPATPDPDPKPGLVCKILDDRINECSGMQYSKKLAGIFWTHNDEGKNPQIYGVKVKDGKTSATINFSGGLPDDPETLRILPNGKLILGDIGDNAGPNDAPTRSSVALYEFTEPSKTGGSTVTPTKYTVKYDIGKRNAECLLVHPTTGQMYIVTKEAGGGHLLKLPASLSGGTNMAKNQSKTMPKMVTDGTYTPNGKFILFRAKGVAETLVYSSSTWKKVGDIKTPALYQGESITMEPEGRSFLVSSERKKGSSTPSPVYRVILPTWAR
jgi:hypothetical protein